MKFTYTFCSFTFGDSLCCPTNTKKRAATEFSPCLSFHLARRPKRELHQPQVHVRCWSPRRPISSRRTPGRMIFPEKRRGSYVFNQLTKLFESHIKTTYLTPCTYDTPQEIRNEQFYIWNTWFKKKQHAIGRPPSLTPIMPRVAGNKGTATTTKSASAKSRGKSASVPPGAMRVPWPPLPWFWE